MRRSSCFFWKRIDLLLDCLGSLSETLGRGVTYEVIVVSNDAPQLAAEREQLLARQDSLETTVRELRTYVNSAGFRIVDAVIRRLRSFPVVFKTIRVMARRIAGRGATVD